MSESNTQRSGGIGCLTILTLIFITLKLTGHITWSWIWVLAPTWIPIAIVSALMLGVLLLVAIKSGEIELWRRRR